MREQTHHMFSYLSPEQRVPGSPAQVRPAAPRRAVARASNCCGPCCFAAQSPRARRPLYTIRSERLLVRNLLFRWFVG